MVGSYPLERFFVDLFTHTPSYLPTILKQLTVFPLLGKDVSQNMFEELP